MKKLAPLNWKRRAYSHLLSMQRFVEMRRKEETSYWFNHARKLAAVKDQYVDLSPDLTKLEAMHMEHYFYYMTCPPATILRDLTAVKSYDNKAINCCFCDGYGYVGDKLCTCIKCQGWGKDIHWVLKKYTWRHKTSYTVFVKSGHELIRTIEIGVGFGEAIL